MDSESLSANGLLSLPELIAQCALGEVRPVRDYLEQCLSEEPDNTIVQLFLEFIALAAPNYAVASQTANAELDGNLFGPDQFERLGNRLATCEGMSEAAALAHEIAGAMDYRASAAHDPLGGPFNGQENRRLLFDDIVKKLGVEAIVETGTHRASTTAYMARATGLPVYSCEVNPRLFAYSRRRLEALPNAAVTMQDSAVFLRSTELDDRIRNRRVFFYLDAHWYERLPLKEELWAILGSDIDPIVMIDDFAVPGDPQYGFDDYGPGKVLRMGYLLQFANASLSYFFPSLPADRETGKQRGCVVVCRAPTDDLLGARVQGFFRLSWRDAVLADLCEPADKDSQIAELTDLRHGLSDVSDQLSSNSKKSALQLAQKDSQIAELTDLRHRLSDVSDQLSSNSKESALQLAQKDSQIAELANLHHRLSDSLDQLASNNKESALQLAQKDGQIATLTSLRHQQTDLLNKLALTNEELQQRVQELMASRWRRLGRRLRLAKAASFEK
jgi:hypothetical protein